MAFSAKAQFKDVYSRELPTTLKVLRAFPSEKSAYKPHERSNTALQLAQTFVIENNMMLAALKGPLKLGGGRPPMPDDFQAVVAAYEKSANELLTTLEATPESRLTETVQFFTGPKTLGDYKVADFLWFMFLDSIHHRGQMSTYLRPVGGKVPSIYGPSGDEPWN